MPEPLSEYTRALEDERDQLLLDAEVSGAEIDALSRDRALMLELLELYREVRMLRGEG